MNFESLKIIPQYLFPQHGVSKLLGRLADKPLGKTTEQIISKFATHYKVNMDEAENPDLKSYKTFNQFFTRALKPGVREICDDEHLASPVDGAVSQSGRIRQSYMIQAKNRDYTSIELLGGDRELADKFDDGCFATIYLSPKDYHRIHMPIDGKLIGMKHIPGKLFSVNPVTARNVPRLFARNERAVCLFQTDLGLMAMIAVGATVVGSIETVWHGTVTPPSVKKVTNFHYKDDKAISLKKGEEMGRFKLGSTVILMFQKGSLSFNQKMKPETVLQYGEAIAHIS